MTIHTHRTTSPQAGFTLVEMATVLVIVGLLLGMAFKGRDLVDGARVKSLYASSSKIQSAMQIFFERYQAWPGDGCNSAAQRPTDCTGDDTNAKDGLISSPEEIGQFWNMLIKSTKLLAATDQKMPTGAQWAVAAGVTGRGGTEPTSTWLVAEGLDKKVVDLRYVCALDQQFDDGDPSSGQIRSNAAVGSGAGQYEAKSDCWEKSGLASLAIHLLP